MRANIKERNIKKWLSENGFPNKPHLCALPTGSCQLINFHKMMATRFKNLPETEFETFKNKVLSGEFESPQMQQDKINQRDFEEQMKRFEAMIPKEVG